MELTLDEVGAFGSFDYIVVGAGSAGSIVASRLAEKGHDVLLLEAGGSAAGISDIWDSRDNTKLWGQIDLQWGYKLTPQPGLDGREMDCTRAKITGGCTAINDMVYARGDLSDYERWVSEYNCTGWRYEDLVPHFEAVESTLGVGPRNDNKFSQDYRVACNSVGIDNVENYNSGEPYGMIGVAPAWATVVKDGSQRITSYEKYVREKAPRLPTLYSIQNVLVDRVNFTGTKATSVSVVVQGSNLLDVPFNKELILSAGSINSPQILMRSGIGPKEDLALAGVKTIVNDLQNVGRNMMGAILFSSTWSVTTAITDQKSNLGNAIVWSDPTADGAPKLCCEMSRGLYSPTQTPEQLRMNYMVTGGSFDLKSRGWVKLKSADPTVAPVIDPKFLSALGDMDQLIEGFKLMRKVAGSSDLVNGWGAKETYPGTNISTDQQIRDWIADNCYSYNHPACSCAMSDSPDTGVVSPELKVFGVEGLRVADASIMPEIVHSHTQGPSFMIGHKAAELILEG